MSVKKNHLHLFIEIGLLKQFKIIILITNPTSNTADIQKSVKNFYGKLVY